MFVEKNLDLKKYTTVKIGGIGKNAYFPENIEELCQLQKQLANDKMYIISGGSNILMNDNKEIEHVIILQKMDQTMLDLGNGLFYCGASVRIQKFIKFAQSLAFGGIEYLYSLPAMMGGIVVMNAGRGEKVGCSISDVIDEVYAVKGGEKVVLKKDDCKFSYRNSIFQDDSYIVTGVKLQLKQMSKSEVQQEIDDRLELCKKVQDHSGSTFGSVFYMSNPMVMRICQKISGKHGIRWSPKRMNWFINDGTGTFKQAYRYIWICRILHKVTGKESKLEVRIWK